MVCACMMLLCNNNYYYFQDDGSFILAIIQFYPHYVKFYYRGDSESLLSHVKANNVCKDIWHCHES